MPTNIGKVLNELIEAFIFYTYHHIETCYVVLRHPLRGPRILAFKHSRAPSRVVSPHSFCLLNIFAAYVYLSYFVRYIFTSLGYALREISSEMESYGAPDIPIFQALIISVLILITFDGAFRLFLLVVERRPQKRALGLASILYSFGVQPLSLVIVATYAWQFDLLNTRYENLISASCLLLLVLLALPAIAYSANVIARYLPLPTKRIPALVLGGLFAGAVYLGSIIEAIALAKWRLLAGGQVRIESLQCYPGAGKGAVSAVVENRTGRRIVLPFPEALATGTTYDDASWRNMTITSIEASFGKEPPFLLLEPDRAVWVKLYVDVVVPEGRSLEECRFSVMDRSFVLAEKRVRWRSQ